jgi:hypothetical protein
MFRRAVLAALAVLVLCAPSQGAPPQGSFPPINGTEIIAHKVCRDTSSVAPTQSVLLAYRRVASHPFVMLFFAEGET